MRISDAFKDRAQLAQLLDPTASAFVEGGEATRAEARRAWHQHRWTAQVMNSSLEELPRSDIEFGRFSTVVHVPSGRLYRLRKDQLPDIEYANAAAFFVDEGGLPILLERPAPSSPQTVDEAERRKADRERQRSAPRPRPSWMTR